MNSNGKKKELRKITAASVSFMTVALLFSSIFSGQKVERITLWNSSVKAAVIIPGNYLETKNKAAAASDGFEMVQSNFVFDRDKMPDNYVVIPKQDKENQLAVITDEYNYRTVYLDIKNKIKNFYNSSSVKRYFKSREFNGEPEKMIFPPYLNAFLNGNPEVSEKDKEAYEKVENGSEKQQVSDDPIINIKILNENTSFTRLALTFNKLYIPELFEDDDNYYISLKKPKDVYNKILVIDLGHGGKDAGTFSGDSRTFEKDTVLAFGLKLKEFFDKQNDIKVYFTRTRDTFLYRRTRVDLANGLGADFFLSIHNNNYTVEGSPINFNEVRGSEIHYNEKIKNTKVSSKRFATLILDGICNSIHTKKRGVVEGSGYYVLGHTTMPSALVEIGYLTNKNDLKIILNSEKMTACAEAVYKAVVQAFKENEE